MAFIQIHSIYYENGNEMNYLNALRFEEELHENMVTMSQPAR